MKKKFLFVLCALLVFCGCTACTETGHTTYTGRYVRAQMGSDILVTELSGEETIVFLINASGDEDLFDDFETGDSIKISTVLVTGDNGVNYADVYKCRSTADVGNELSSETLGRINEIEAKSLITVVSGDEQIQPYIHLLNSTEWTKKGWLSTDYELFIHVLPDVAEKLPELIYAENIDSIWSGDLSYVHLSVYNEAYEKINLHNETWNMLYGLPKGTYYVVVTVRREGEYIKEGNANETKTFECAFKLIK